MLVVVEGWGERREEKRRDEKRREEKRREEKRREEKRREKKRRTTGKRGAVAEVEKDGKLQKREKCETRILTPYDRVVADGGGMRVFFATDFFLSHPPRTFRD